MLFFLWPCQYQTVSVGRQVIKLSGGPSAKRGRGRPPPTPSPGIGAREFRPRENFEIWDAIWCILARNWRFSSFPPLWTKT